MPEMSGIQVTEEIRKIDPSKTIKIVAYSASMFFEGEKIDTAFNLFDGLIIKPARVVDIYRQLMQHLKYRTIEQTLDAKVLSNKPIAMDPIKKEELLKLLAEQFDERWTRVLASRYSEEAQLFAEDILFLASKYQSEPLAEFANGIITALANYDLTKAFRYLNDFKTVIQNL